MNSHHTSNTRLTWSTFQLRWKTFILLCGKFIHDYMYKILWESAGFCRWCDKNILVVFFSGLQCRWCLLVDLLYLQWSREVSLFDVRLSVSQSQGLIAIPQDNRHIHLYDISGVRYGRPTKMSKVTVEIYHTPVLTVMMMQMLIILMTCNVDIFYRVDQKFTLL